MRRTFVLPLATGLVALALPLTGGGATAAPVVLAEEETGNAFGYSALTTASPVKVEIFEPTIPIPATPQAEFELGYTKVVADSTSGRGRATFLWPGDAVGEGAKTILENLGLPPEVVAPIAEQGYPLQVNSTFPSGPELEANEPIPGAVMRTGAAEGATYAQSGFSSSCDTSGGEDGAESGEGGGAGIPGLPELPLPELPLPIPGLDALLGLQAERAATTTRSSGRTVSADDETAPAAECQVPAQLTALVQIGGFSASSSTKRTDDEIKGVSRAAVGDISLLGGLIELSGVTSKVTSSSDGTEPTGKGKASYGTLTLAGQEFGIGPDGIVAQGQTTPLPGLPDDPTAALATLGVTITVPEPSFEVDGKEVKSLVEGLVVTIDGKALTDALRTLPLQTLLDQLPAEAADLTKALQAAVNLSPKIVLHLGYAASKVETADPLDIPDVVPDNDPEGEDEGETEGGTGGGGAGGGTGGGGVTTPAGTTPVAGGAPTTETALPSAELASGLPDLFSIPGLLLVGSIAGACVAGSYVRRMGALALGGGGACSHGLDSGLPDLRKAQ